MLISFFTKIKKKNYLIFLLIFTLLPFVLLSFFDHPSYDDYWFANEMKELGFWGAQKYWHYSWTGRFFATALLSFHPLAYDSFFCYKIVPILLLFSTSISFLLLMNTIFDKTMKLEKLTIFSVFIFLLLSQMPNIVQGIYWMPASVTNIFADILLIILVTSILYIKKIRNKNLKFFFSIFINMLCIAIIGSNEITMVFLWGLLIAWIAIEIYLYKRIYYLHILLIISTVIASYVSIYSPGNFVRMACGGHNSESAIFSFAFFYGILYTLKFICLWFPFSIILILFFDNTFYKIAGYFQDKYPKFKVKLFYLLILIIFFIGLDALCFFVFLWASGNVKPVDRLVDSVFIFYIFEMFVTIILLIIFLKKHNIKIRPLSLPYKIILGLILLACIIVRPNNIRTAYNDLISGKAYYYDKEMKMEYSLIKNIKEDSLIIEPPLKHYPKSLFIYGITTRPKDSKNVGVANYFNKRSIAVTKDYEINMKNGYE